MTVQAAPPAPPPAADPGPSANDEAFLAALRRVKINVSDTSEAIFGAHWVCGELRDGYSHADVITAVKGRKPDNDRSGSGGLRGRLDGVLLPAV